MSGLGGEARRPGYITVDTEKLLADKSVKIMYANALRDSGRIEHARTLFLEAAELEMAVHRLRGASEEGVRDWTSLLSAACCYWQAGQHEYAAELLERVIDGADDEAAKAEARHCLSECRVDMVVWPELLHTYEEPTEAYTPGASNGGVAKTTEGEEL